MFRGDHAINCRERNRQPNPAPQITWMYGKAVERQTSLPGVKINKRGWADRVPTGTLHMMSTGQEMRIGGILGKGSNHANSAIR